MTDDHPPLQERLPVIFRALCHGSFVLRGLMEQIIATRTDEIEVGRSKTRSVVLNRWLRTQGLEEHLTEPERTLLAIEPGEWSAEDRAFASWRIESQGILVWAIEKLDTLPPPDELFNPGEVIDALPNMAPLESFLRFTRLRPADDLLWARDVIELWHWRTRIERMRREDDGADYEERIANVVEGALTHDAIPEALEDDFPAFGKPVTALDATELMKLHTITYYRHFALNWVCGYALAKEWEATPTHT